VGGARGVPRRGWRRCPGPRATSVPVSVAWSPRAGAGGRAHRVGTPQASLCPPQVVRRPANGQGVMKKEAQDSKTTGCVPTTRRAGRRRAGQGASVRVPSPRARPASPWETQRAAWGAPRGRSQQSPVGPALANHGVSMRWSSMSKRTAAHETAAWISASLRPDHASASSPNTTGVSRGYHRWRSTGRASHHRVSADRLAGTAGRPVTGDRFWRESL
jgi:hypothetical protein